MPEGDTIFKTAAGLRRALLGRPIAAAQAPWTKSIGRWPIERLVGTVVEAVEPRGKHLLIRFSNGLVLHSHMQMGGSWHLYRPGERWQLPRQLARVILRTEALAPNADRDSPEALEAVCFRAPTVELLSPSEIAAHPALTSLGPDLLADDFDAAQAHRRLRQLPDTPLGQAIMDQRALAGIGNVYKSETLFLSGLSPFTPVGALSAADLDRLIAQARRLLQANVSVSPERSRPYRTTTGQARPGADLWVYGRAGRPCRRCATVIRIERQAGRATYWCARCQH